MREIAEAIEWPQYAEQAVSSSQGEMAAVGAEPASADASERLLSRQTAPVESTDVYRLISLKKSPNNRSVVPEGGR
jgi:hypothetical protein